MIIYWFKFKLFTQEPSKSHMTNQRTEDLEKELVRLDCIGLLVVQSKVQSAHFFYLLDHY